MSSFARWLDARPARRPDGGQRSRRSRPGIESLETRAVLYSATGNAWLNPAVITISFMPDGTPLGGATSNLISTFNNNPGLSGRWQAEILRAAQVWAQQTNINFVVVPDDGAAWGAGGNQQGDPGHGDIRIGGYAFGNPNLAAASQPPPVNNFSVAGDIVFNTGMGFNIGQTYDLFTVASHEIGHALGLDHSSAGSGAAMYPTYVGKKSALAADDIAGIRQIYSGSNPRSSDAFGSKNSSFAAAADIRSSINQQTLTGLVTDLDISVAGQADYFTFSAPTSSTGTMRVMVQSSGLSLLSPTLTVYAADRTTVLGTASGAGRYGATLTVSTAASPGQVFYVRVQGADTTAFGTGTFALGLSFNGAAPPLAPSKVAAFANGSPLRGGGGSPDQAEAEAYRDATPTIKSISPDTGSSSNDGVTGAGRITLSGIAPTSSLMTVYRDGVVVGTTTSDFLLGNWSFDSSGAALDDGTYEFTVTGTDRQGTVSTPSYPFRVTVDSQAPATPSIKGVAPGVVSGTTIRTATQSPILFGTAEPCSQVTVYSGLTVLGTATSDPNGNWDLAYSTLGGLLGTTYSLLGVLLGGGYNIGVRATDRAGNSSDSTSYTVTTTQAGSSAGIPTVSSAALSCGSVIARAADGSFATTATPTVTGLATANTQVVVLLDGTIAGICNVDWLGRWTVMVPVLPPGRHRLSFRAVDSDGDFGAEGWVISVQYGS